MVYVLKQSSFNAAVSRDLRERFEPTVFRGEWLEDSPSLNHCLQGIAKYSVVLPQGRIKNDYSWGEVKISDLLCQLSIMSPEIEEDPQTDGYTFARELTEHDSAQYEQAITSILTPPVTRAEAWLCPRCVARRQIQTDEKSELAARSQFKLKSSVNLFFTIERSPSPVVTLDPRSVNQPLLVSEQCHFAAEPSEPDSAFIGDAQQESATPQELVCPVAGCVDRFGRPRRFERREHCRRHWKTVHEKKDLFVCEVDVNGKPCGKVSSREDNLKSHKRTHVPKTLRIARSTPTSQNPTRRSCRTGNPRGRPRKSSR